jgi:UDP-N-acetylglucosamine 4,6-dehydratase
MISPDEGRRVVRLADRYLVQPELGSFGFQPPEDAVPVEDGFMYRSDLNDQWYSQDQIRALLDDLD